ncbi:MAG: hypothetical protein AAGG08_19360, partial [Actinomycetota bacterium]
MAGDVPAQAPVGRVPVGQAPVGQVFVGGISRPIAHVERSNCRYPDVSDVTETPSASAELLDLVARL